MKAIKINKKYALPLMLLGLLALDTSWEKFLKHPITSGTFASSSIDIEKKATQVCANPNNDMARALTTAYRQNGYGEFYFQKNGEDIKDTIRSKGKSADIEYNGLVQINEITNKKGEKGPFPLHTLVNGSPVLSHFGLSNTKPERPVPKIDPTTNEPYQVECFLDENNNIKRENSVTRDIDGTDKCQFPTYRFFAIRVKTETTEGDWCDDCDSEVARENSEVRYIKAQVYPNEDLMQSICEDAYAHAQSLFAETEKDMKKGIAEQLEEIAELAEKEKFEKYRERMVEECRIRPGATLKEIKKYREKREIDEDLTYAGEPEEKLECLGDNLEDQDSVFARNAYWKAHVSDFLRGYMSSADASQRSQGKQFLQDLRGGEYGALTANEQGHLTFMENGSNQLETMYRLTAAVERFRGTPQEIEWKMRLDAYKNSLNMQYGALAANGHPDVFDEGNFWQSKITELETTTSLAGIPSSVTSGLGDPSSVSNALSYNMSGRVGRLSQGHIPLGSTFQSAMDRITTTPSFMGASSTYYRGGTDAYERNYQNYPGTNRSGYTATRPPGAESTGGSRLVRGGRM